MNQKTLVGRVSRVMAALALCGAPMAGAQVASDAPQGAAPVREAMKAVVHTPRDASRSAASFGTPGVRPERAPAPALPLGAKPTDAVGGEGGTAGNPPDSGNGGSEGGVTDVGLTLIDFESLRHNDANVNLHGYVYEEDGFVVSHDNDEPFEFATFGTQEARFPGSTALYNNTVGGVNYLYANDFSPFSVSFIEISNLNNNGPSTTTFTGYRYDGTTVTRVCTTGTDYNRQETFVFTGFHDLFYVEWTQDSPFHQFDNIGLFRAPVLIDFQSLEIVNNSVNTVGATYFEDGFMFSKGGGESPNFSTFGTLEARYPGSTALFNNTVNGVTYLEQVNGGTFNVHSIDLSNLNNNGPTQVTFTGTRPGGSIIQKTMTTPGAPNGLATYEFAGFNDLVRLEWVQESPYHQFDNLVISRGRQVIDFLKLSIGDAQSHDWGDTYREDGFIITKGPGEPFGFNTFGTQESRYVGSTALYNNTANGLIHIDTIDDVLFQLHAVDIASLNSDAPVTVDFVGHRNDGATLNRSFTTSGNGQRLEVVTFNSDWRNLRDVEWTQASPFHQFDNITLVRTTTLIDFQSLEHMDAGITEHGSTYKEDAFQIDDPDKAGRLSTFGTLEARYPGSTALFTNVIGGTTRLTASDGSNFDLLQMDVTQLNNVGGGPVTVHFVGTKTDGSTVTRNFTAYENIQLQTCEFSGFDTLTKVEWTQDAPYHQFDNIVVVKAKETDCYADCDGSGSLDLFDFLCFTNAFNANQGYANCDGNGAFDLFDFLCYVNAFNDGC